MTSKLKTIAIALGAAALLTPAGALAQSEHASKGKAKSQEKSSKAKKKGHAKPKNAVFKGTVVSVEGSTLTVAVTKTNKWGRGFDDSDVAFSVVEATKVKVADTNGDTKFDLADFKAGDKVHVQARITRDAAAPLTARSVKNQTAPKPKDDSEDEAAPAPAPAP